MDLKATWNNIVICVDTRKKESFRFSDGTEIKLERGWNNFNLREVNPVQGIVIDSSTMDVPNDTEILFQHTCFHATYELFNVRKDSGKDVESPYRYFSVPISLCFAWRYQRKEWQPMKGFLITTRVWKPYEGLLQIPPSLIPNRLYVKEGELKNNIVITLKYCDYEIVFQGDNGREDYLISTKLDDEVVAIDNGLTEKYQEGNILIGRTVDEAKPIKNISYVETV